MLETSWSIPGVRRHMFRLFAVLVGAKQVWTLVTHVFLHSDDHTAHNVGHKLRSYGQKSAVIGTVRGVQLCNKKLYPTKWTLKYCIIGSRLICRLKLLVVCNSNVSKFLADCQVRT
jgi:hypothetical protein